MKNYERVYRFLIEDKDKISEFLSNPVDSYASDYTVVANREDGTDPSPLEFYFERMLSNVYGRRMQGLHTIFTMFPSTSSVSGFELLRF